MPFTDIWIHFVWATKYRKPCLTTEVRHCLFRHIRAFAWEKGIHLDCINGYTDHVHCLIKLDPTMPVYKVAQLIKGESSRWMNERQILPHKFIWQHEYYAASISNELLPRYRGYIAKQERHHANKSYQVELKILKENRIPEENP